MALDGMAFKNRTFFALQCLSPAGIMFGRDQTPITLFQGEIFDSLGLNKCPL